MLTCDVCDVVYIRVVDVDVCVGLHSEWVETFLGTAINMLDQVLQITDI